MRRFAENSLWRSEPWEGKTRRLPIIYLHIPESFRIDLIDVYGKDEKDDLTAKEKKVLSKLAAAARQEALSHWRR